MIPSVGEYLIRSLSFSRVGVRGHLIICVTNWELNQLWYMILAMERNHTRVESAFTVRPLYPQLCLMSHLLKTLYFTLFRK